MLEFVFFGFFFLTILSFCYGILAKEADDARSPAKRGWRLVTPEERGYERSKAIQQHAGRLSSATALILRSTG